VSGEQLARLDDLHAHLQRGGGIADFLQKPEDSSDEYDEQGGQLVQSDQPTALVALVETLASRLEGITVQMAPTRIDSLAYLRVLQEAAEQEWELSTSELAALLNLAPDTIRRYGKSFTDSGFTFTRTGGKKRGEIAWAVDKGRHK
jgi:response regulator of citrate/malate metabolism